MAEPIRVSYQHPETSPSGMIVEEVLADAGGPARGRWPFQAAHFVVPAGATSEPDVHDVVELWMIRDGTGVVCSADRRIEVREGEMIFFPSRVPHQVTNTGNDPLRVFTVWWREAPQ